MKNDQLPTEAEQEARLRAQNEAIVALDNDHRAKVMALSVKTKAKYTLVWDAHDAKQDALDAEYRIEKEALDAEYRAEHGPMAAEYLAARAPLSVAYNATRKELAKG